jgi:hypothetical protein
MRALRIAAALAAVAATLVAPTAADAATSTLTMPFDDSVTACNGDTIHLTGQLLGVFSVTFAPSGTVLISSHIQPQGVRGTDVQTGATYQGTGLTTERLVAAPGGGFTYTLVNRFHLQATAGADSFDASETLHITVSPDGTVTAFVADVSGPC